MPRFFFHRMDGLVDRDTDGTELPTLSEARKAAVVFAGETLKFHPEVAWSGTEFRVEVTDAQQRIVFVLRVLADDAQRSEVRETSST